jgi:Protein of unknown function (DUF4065)
LICVPYLFDVKLQLKEDDMNQQTPTFDREKFLDVVHFICSQCEPADLGKVKLHKILYFADMLAFLDEFKPLTGVEYQKQAFGPVAKHLTWAIDELAKQGRLCVTKREYFGFTKLDFVSIQLAPSHRLTNREVELLQGVIGFVCAKTATEISELSHNAAWHRARLGETIPYESAFGLIPVEVTEQDLAASVAEAKRIRPMIDATRQAR